MTSPGTTTTWKCSSGDQWGAAAFCHQCLHSDEDYFIKVWRCDRNVSEQDQLLTLTPDLEGWHHCWQSHRQSERLFDRSVFWPHYVVLHHSRVKHCTLCFSSSYITDKILWKMLKKSEPTGIKLHSTTDYLKIPWSPRASEVKCIKSKADLFLACCW